MLAELLVSIMSHELGRGFYTSASLTEGSIYLLQREPEFWT